MPKVTVDPASTSLKNCYALVHTKRKNRQRFPAGCVTVVEDESAAVSGSDDDKQLYGAIVYGPSTSSEGTQIYYLVRWLS